MGFFANTNHGLRHLAVGLCLLAAACGTPYRMVSDSAFYRQFLADYKAAEKCLGLKGPKNIHYFGLNGQVYGPRERAVVPGEVLVFRFAQAKFSHQGLWKSGNTKLPLSTVHPGQSGPAARAASAADDYVVHLGYHGESGYHESLHVILEANGREAVDDSGEMKRCDR